MVVAHSSGLVDCGSVVPPAATEAALLQSPLGFDCAAATEPDGQLGQVPVAYVVGSRERPIYEAVAVARSLLPASQCPRRIYYVPALPRDPAGQVTHQT